MHTGWKIALGLGTTVAGWYGLNYLILSRAEVKPNGSLKAGDLVRVGDEGYRLTTKLVPVGFLKVGYRAQRLVSVPFPNTPEIQFVPALANPSEVVTIYPDQIMKVLQSVNAVSSH
jgi:hypothetical protein